MTRNKIDENVEIVFWFDKNVIEKQNSLPKARTRKTKIVKKQVGQILL